MIRVTRRFHLGVSGFLQVLGAFVPDQVGDSACKAGVVVQLWVGVNQFRRGFTCSKDQVLVLEQSEQSKLTTTTGLCNAEHVTLPTLLQVKLSELETVKCFGNRFEAGTGR